MTDQDAQTLLYFRPTWSKSISYFRPKQLENHSLLWHTYLSRVYVVVQLIPWFNVYFPLFLFMVMYDHELKTKENEN